MVFLVDLDHFLYGTDLIAKRSVDMVLKCIPGPVGFNFLQENLLIRLSYLERVLRPCGKGIQFPGDP